MPARISNEVYSLNNLLTPSLISVTAIVAGTVTTAGCNMVLLYVSSKSRAWPVEAFAWAALRTETDLPYFASKRSSGTYTKPSIILLEVLPKAAFLK
jgi:hypothetical protein